MENKEIARLLSETADLMEVAGEDGFRIRSYRNAASVIVSYPERVADIVCNPDRKVTEIPGIGKGLSFVLSEICQRGSFDRRDEMLATLPRFSSRTAQNPRPWTEKHRASLRALQRAHSRRS